VHGQPSYPQFSGSDTWLDLGLYGGVVFSIAVDPRNTDILYAGSWGGDGLFKSVDGGRTWQRIPDFRNAIVYSVALSPSDSQVVWATTSDFIARSEDGGLTWRFFDPTLEEGRWRHYFSVALDPEEPRVAYVGCSGPFGKSRGGAIYRTEDGGQSWKKATLVADHSVWDIAVHGSKSQVVWAVTNSQAGSGGGVYRSEDGGRTWGSRSRGLGRGWLDEVVLHPADPDLVFVGGEEGVWRTQDGGGTWKPLAPDSWCRALVLDPHDPRIVYASWEKGFSTSLDGGDSWMTVGHGDLELVFLDLAVDREGSGQIYGGHLNLGVAVSSDGGLTWALSGSGLRANHVFASTADPANPNHYLVGTIAGVFKGNSGGWDHLEKSPSEAVAIHPLKTGTMYAGMDWGVAKSTDGGKSWTYHRVAEHDRFHTVVSLALDSSDPRVLYGGVRYQSGLRGEVYKSVDGGETWRKVLRTGSPVNVVTVDPSDCGTLYAGSGTFYDNARAGQLFKSTDYGGSWSTTGLGGLVINDVAIRPDEPSVLFAGCGDPGHHLPGGVFRSSDGGMTWVESSGGMPQDAIVVDVETDGGKPHVAYAATYAQGIYVSLDGGEYWTQVGLSDYRLYSLSPLLQRGGSYAPGGALPATDLHAGTASGFYQHSFSGQGLVAGMVMDRCSGVGLDSAQVSCTCGGAASTVGGAYTLITSSGSCGMSVVAGDYTVASGSLTVLAGETAYMDFTLAFTGRSYSVSGKVSDSETGNGLAGAVVHVLPSDMSTVTLEDGAFTVDCLRAGSHTVTASKAGYSPSQKHVTLPAGAGEAVELWLSPLHLGSIGGVVRDARTGDGIGGAVVSVRGGSQTATTDIHGIYHMGELVEGAYTLNFRATGYARQRLAAVGVKAGETTQADAALKPIRRRGRTENSSSM
jgi:photosystem II stability/assembly factor-like uncharacterized protein